MATIFEVEKLALDLPEQERACSIHFRGFCRMKMKASLKP